MCERGASPARLATCLPSSAPISGIDAMGGDPDQIRVLIDRLAFDDEGLETLSDELDKFEPEAIIIDPWVSFVPTDIRIKDPNAIQVLLGKIEDIAKDYGCAVILIRHLTKMKHDKPKVFRVQIIPPKRISPVDLTA